MKINKITYFMLLVTGFTFIGLSGIQNASFFTDLFGNHKIVIELNTEEENEASPELKVTEGNEVEKQNELTLLGCNRLNFIAFHNVFALASIEYLEVSTPPPEVKFA